MTRQAESQEKQEHARTGEAKGPSRHQIPCACGAPGDLSDVEPVLVPRGALGQQDKRGLPAPPTAGAADGAHDASGDDET
jgi:hypothetical protein